MNDVIICHGSNYHTISNRQQQRKKGTHENQTCDNIQAQRRSQRNHNIPKDGIREQTVEIQSSSSILNVFDALECKEERSECHINRDESKTNHRACVAPL